MGTNNNNINKYIKLVVIVLLLIPFRLPINIILINFFTNIATLVDGEVLTQNLLVANVLVTKIIYNLILGMIFVKNIESLCRVYFKSKKVSYTYNKPTEVDLYNTTVGVIIALIIYLGFDISWSYELATIIIK